MWDVLLAILAICSMCVFLAKQTKMPAGVTPLVAICSTTLWFAIVGALGFLWVGGIIWYTLCLVLVIFTIVKYGLRSSLCIIKTPSFLFFVIACLLVCLYLGIRQPFLHEWDEYSLWGTVVKIMKTNNELYTTAPSGFPWPSTQTPTLPVWTYFVQFFGGFADWKIYAAYSFLYLAVISVLIGTVPMRKYQVAVPLAIIGLLTPWFMTIYTRQYEPKLVWLLAYGDITAGMLFAGVLLLYFVIRTNKLPLWPVLPVLAVLALVKENTFVFSLAAAGVMLLDLLIIRPTKLKNIQEQVIMEQRATGRIKKIFGGAGEYTLLGRIGYGLCYFIAAIIPYKLWSMHIGSVVVARQSVGIVDPVAQEPVSALVRGTKMLFGLEERTPWFSENWKAMWDAFFWGKNADGDAVIGGFTIGMIGGGFIVVCVITLLFLLAIFLLKNKQARLRVVISYFALLMCFIGYSYELFISYVFIFQNELEMLASYNRYMYGYYIGWFLVSIYFVGYAALSYKKQGKGGEIPGFRVFLAQVLLLLFAGGMMIRTNALLPLENSDVGYVSRTFDAQIVEKNLADSVSEAIHRDSSSDDLQRIFFVSQGDNGRHWFVYHYLMLPDVVDYSGVMTKIGGAGGGGGTYISPALLEEQAKESLGTYTEEELEDYVTGARGGFNTYSPEDLQAYIEEAGINYILLEKIDDQFIDSYSELFTDGLEQVIDGKTVLYRVEEMGGSLQFSPVEMEVPIR